MTKLQGDARRDAGRNCFTRLLAYLLKDISHPEMSLLADWALNEPGCLHTSQLSHLRNAKMRMLGVKSLDALGMINVAAYNYQNRDRETLQKLGTAPVTARVEEILSRYQPLVDQNFGEPLNAGDLMMVYLGYVIPEGIEAEGDKRDWDAVSSNLPDWLEGLIEERGMRSREAVIMIRKSWRGDEKGLNNVLMMVSGARDLSAAETMTLWPEITKSVEAVIGENTSEQELLEMVCA